MTLPNRWMKHGETVVLLVNNQYGNPSERYYYVDSLLAYLMVMEAKHNEQDVFLIRSSKNM